jgi:hypothetical protein
MVPTTSPDAAAPALPTTPPGVDTRPPLYDAFGEHSGEYHPRGDERRFLIVFGLVALAIIASVIAFNAVVDPYGTLGTGVDPPVETQSGERLGKVDLLAQMDPAPKTLLLGTSTMRMYDPHYHERVSGDRAFNASVSGSSLRTAFAFAAYAHRDLGENPHIVLGLDVEGMAKRPEESLGDERLQSQLSQTQQLTMKLTDLRPIADLRTVDVSVKAIQHRNENSEPADSETSALAGARRKFDDNGFVHKDPLIGVRRDARIQTQIENYARNLYRNGGYTELDANMRDTLRDTVELANDYGDTPTIILMPLLPEVHDVLGPLGRDDRRDEIRRFAQSIEDNGLKMRFVDFSDPKSFGANVAGFHDGVHMDADNMHRMIDELERRGAL